MGGITSEAAHTVVRQTGSPLAGKFTANLINAAASSGVHTAVNGGSLKDNLGNAALGALVNTVHGEIASKIKIHLSEDYIAHKITHAVAGCGAAAANKGKCRDGAIGAAIGEMVGEALVGNRRVQDLSPKERERILGYAKIVAGSVAALSKGDANTAANAAQEAVINNSLRIFEALIGGQKGSDSLASATSLYENQIKNGKTLAEAQRAVELHLQGYGLKQHTGTEVLLYGSIAIPIVLVGGKTYVKKAGSSVLEGIILSTLQRQDYKTSNLIYDSSLGVLVDRKTGYMIRWSGQKNRWIAGYLNTHGRLENELLSRGATPAISHALGKYDKTIFQSSEWMDKLLK